MKIKNIPMLLVILIISVFCIRCGDNNDNIVGDGFKVNIDGGSFTGPDGMQLIIPAGAIAIDVEFTIKEVQPPEIEETTQVGRFYQINPVNIEFVKDITVKIPYNPNSIPDEYEEKDVRIWTNGSSSWERLNDEPDTAEAWAIGKVSRFGTFGPLIGEPAGVPEPKPSILTSNVLDFDLVEMGDSVKETIEIESKGNADLIISSITIDDDSAFSLSNIAANTAIAVGESVKLDITFAPMEQIDYTALVVINSNDPEVPKWEIGLFGVGAGTGDAELEKSTIDFGEAVAGETFNDSVVVKNFSTTGKLRIISISMMGDNVFSFTEPSNLMIDKESQLQIPVSCTPAVSQDYSSEMKIEVDDIDNPELEVYLTISSGSSDGDLDEEIDGDFDQEEEIEIEAEMEIDQNEVEEVEIELEIETEEEVELESEQVEG